MTHQERRAWLIVGSLFVELLVVFGAGYNTAGVFFTPLLKQFNWSHAQISYLQAALALAAGVSVPLIGWLLDRVEARVVMTAGILCTGLSFVMASRVNSFPAMFTAYAVLGLGIAASTLLPCALVVSNWFGANRGIALGVTFAGTSTGGMLMTLVADRAIAAGGWRLGYLTLAAPMFVIAIPLVILAIRTRPATAEGGQTVAESSDALPGLEVAEALRARSFWMIAAAQFCFALAAAGAGLHLINHLIGVGYAPARAALAMSLVFGANAIGKLAFGRFSDRVSGRVALSLSLGVSAGGVLLLLGAGSGIVLAAFVAIYGLTLGAPLVLVPMVTVESLGLKRFGSLSGLAGLANTAGAAIGPVAAGHIFDVTRSYAGAFELFSAVLALGALAILATIPLAQAKRELQPAAATA